MALMAQNDTAEVVIPITIPDTINDSTSVITNNIEDSIEVNDPTLDIEGYHNLRRFYSKLQKLEQTGEGSVRVAYFGDSMNDGDLIVQDVRSAFQKNYGGHGVGFVAISSLSAGARGSISHQHSKNWLVQSFVKVKKPTKPFGVDGQVFFANNSSQQYWVRYRAMSQPNSTELNNPTLFYGKKSSNQNAYITVKANKDSSSVIHLHPTEILNKAVLSQHNLKSLQVDFHQADSVPIYGFNFDDGKGVHVDNFSIRGNSGLPLSVLNPSLMNAFDRELGYDLIILHYGANVLGYGSTNYNWYEKNMTTVVNNLRQCFPNADILIISTADKSSMIDGTMQTDPAVVPLAKAQKKYALKTRSGYINLYSEMGGNGSMVTWVDKGLANKDYTHFNITGSKKIANFIYTEIDKGYTKYKQAQTENYDLY